MNTPLQAMLWELWRLSRWEILGRTLGQLLLVGLFYALTFGPYTTPESIPVLRGICLMLLMMVSLFSTTWLGNLDSRQTGFCFRLGFTRPISTTMLVLVPLLFTMMTAVLCFLLPVLLFRLLFGAGMPFFGPAAVIVCCIAVFVMTTWSPTTLFGKFLGIGLGITGMFWGMAGLHAMSGDPDPILLVLGKPEGLDLGWPEYLGLVLITCLSIVVTVVAVDRQRHGGAFPWKIRIRRPHLRQRLWENRPPFSSPFAAQFWFEFRRVAPRMLVTGLLLPLVAMFVIALAKNENPTWPYAPLAWLFALMVCPVLCQFIGIEGAVGLRYKQGAVQYSVFEATRSLRTDQIVMIKLFVVAACSVAAWFFMAGVAGIHAVLANDGHNWRKLQVAFTEVQGTIHFSWWWLAGACTLLLFYLSSSSMLLAFVLWVPLHGRLFFGLCLIGYTHLILAVADSANAHWSLRSLWIAYGWIFSPMIVFGSLAVLWKALASGSLSSRIFGSTCVLWIAYVAFTLAIYGKASEWLPIPAAALALSASALLVPLATTAIAPLALSSYRHH